MGVGIGEKQGGAVTPWIFIRSKLTDKVEGGLMVLFFGLVFLIAPILLEIFLPTPLVYVLEC